MLRIAGEVIDGEELARVRSTAFRAVVAKPLTHGLHEILCARVNDSPWFFL